MRIRILPCAGLLALSVTPTFGDDDPSRPGPGAYTLTIPTNRHGNFDLIRVNLEGKDESRLTRDPKGAMEPAWSPDGKAIVFVSFRTGKGQIFALPEGEGEPRNLTNSDSYERNPVWSPDGKRIAFTSQRDGNQEIYVMEADGSNPKNLSNNDAFDADPCWSPDGKRIAFASNRTGSFRLFVMNADGSDQKDLMEKDLYSWLYPAWSPDGKRIAVGALTEDRTIQLFLVSPDGEDVKQITEGAYLNSYAAWSPDGKYLAYVHFDDPIPGLQPGEEFDVNDPGGDLMIYDLGAEKSTRISQGDLPLWGPRADFKPTPKADEPR